MLDQYPQYRRYGLAHPPPYCGISRRSAPRCGSLCADVSSWRPTARLKRPPSGECVTGPPKTTPRPQAEAPRYHRYQSRQGARHRAADSSTLTVRDASRTSSPAQSVLDSGRGSHGARRANARYRGRGLHAHGSAAHNLCIRVSTWTRTQRAEFAHSSLPTRLSRIFAPLLDWYSPRRSSTGTHTVTLLTPEAFEGRKGSGHSRAIASRASLRCSTDKRCRTRLDPGIQTKHGICQTWSTEIWTL